MSEACQPSEVAALRGWWLVLSDALPVLMVEYSKHIWQLLLALGNSTLGPPHSHPVISLCKQTASWTFMLLDCRGLPTAWR